MKKRFLALLLGGLLAASGLSMAAPMDVQAGSATCTDTKKHFTVCTVTPGDGQLMVQWESDIATTEIGIGWNYNDMEYFVADEKVDGCIGKTVTEFCGEVASTNGNSYEWVKREEVGSMKAGTHAFTGLTNDTTYYVYVCVAPRVDENGQSISSNDGGVEHPQHTFMYVGSCTPAAGLSNSLPAAPAAPAAPADSSEAEPSFQEAFLDKLDEQIEEAESGSTIVMEEGISALSNGTMKQLLEKGDVDLRMEFTYEGVDYVIVIPAGTALDNDIPWYGPLYLAQHFGNRAGTEETAAGSYTVQPGDSLSRIAAKSGMTLAQLVAKNPQITDIDKITVGQKINR